MNLVLCYDAIDIASIPATAENFLGYESTLAWLAQRFPKAKKVWRITTDADPTAFLDYDGIDCENGDATPLIAAQWCFNKIHEGLGRPWSYQQLANRHFVVDELARLDLAFGDQVDCWMARWLNDPTPPTAMRTGMDDGYDWGVGNVAWQFWRQSEFTYDVSVVNAAWAFPSAPKPKEDDVQLYIRDPKTQECGLVLADGTARNLAAFWPAIEAAYRTAGVPMVVAEAEGIFSLFGAAT